MHQFSSQEMFACMLFNGTSTQEGQFVPTAEKETGLVGLGWSAQDAL